MIYSIEEIKRITVPIAARHGVARIHLFGSYARGEATESSDIDFRVDSGQIRDLFGMGALYADLQEKLQKPLDIVTTEGSEADFLDRIKPDEVLLYEQPGQVHT